MATSYYKPGSWNVICDLTGKKLKADQVKKTWDGFYVRKQSWEPRNPLDFVLGVRDNIAVPFTRPDKPTAIRQLTSNYTCQSSDNGTPILCNALNGGFSVSLDPNPTITETLTIKKTDSSENIVYVINPVTNGLSFALFQQGMGVVLQWNNGWNLLDTMPENQIPPVSTSGFLEFINNVGAILQFVNKEGQWLIFSTQIYFLHLINNNGQTLNIINNVGNILNITTPEINS